METFRKNLNQKASQLTNDLNSFLSQRNVPIKIMNFSSVIYYSYPKDLNYFSLLFYVLRHKGIHILEGFPMFMSEAHSEEDIKKIIDAFKESIIELQDNGFFPAPLNSPKEINKTSKGEEIKFPLTEAQKEIWLASILSDNATCAFNESSNLEFKGKMNIEALDRAFIKLIDRHEALRTVFSPDGKYQIVKDSSQFKLKISDISGLSHDEKLSTVQKRINNETLLPFDLANGPLIRAELYKLGEEEHWLILTAHHVICDGWSYDVMVRDLSRIYTEEVENNITNPEMPMQMHEFVSYVEGFNKTSEYSGQEKYWLNQLSQPPEFLELPSDKGRPSSRTFNGYRITKEIPVDLYSKIKSLGVKTGNTLFVSLLSAYFILLYKLTGQEDIITGIPAAGQQVVGADNLVGHCTNLLPIRSLLKPEKTFIEFVREIKSLVLDAYDNQQVTYGELIKKLKIHRDPGKTPLVSNMFNIDPAIMGLKFHNLECIMKVNQRTAYQFELGFNIVAADKECEIECDYNTDIFSEQAISSFLNYYITVNEQVVENKEICLKDIQLLSSADMSELFKSLSNV